MCGAAYTPAEATNKPKIHRVEAAGEVHPPIGGRDSHRNRGSGDPCAENMEVGADLWGILVSSASGIPEGCVFSMSVW